MTPYWTRFLALGLALALSTPALAAGAPADRSKPDRDAEDEDEEETELAAEKPQAESKARLVEVARGIFVQADPGTFDYMGSQQLVAEYPPLGDGLFWGPSVRLHAGADVFTKDRFGLSVQATFWQVINKGYSEVQGYITQGATRSFLYEAALRPTVLLGPSGRLNLFLRLGGGVGFLQQSRNEVAVEGIYSSLEYGLNPKPFVSGGGGIEYYTRLSHFSFTFAELNFLIFPGLAQGLGVNFAGFKYTF